jgi:hypothetical protein
MDEIRIDRIEGRLEELAAEMRAGFKAVDARFCINEARLDKIGSQLEQTATKVALAELRAEMYRLNGELKGWMVATTLTMMATFLAALFGLQRLAG